MRDNIHYLDIVTKLDISPDRVVDAIKEQNLKEIIVIGYSEDDEFFFTSNKADATAVLWMLEKAKKILL